MLNRNVVATSVIAIVLSLMPSMRSNAQCELAWDPQFGPSGANSEVLDAVVFDDGTGPAVFVCGTFTIAGGINARYIAKFDGEHWSTVGGDFDSNPTAMAVFDDGGGAELYVAGEFSDIGGASISYLAKWDGTQWSAVPGGTFDNPPTYLFASNAPFGTPRLYASGTFSDIGGTTIQGAAMFNGATWSSIAGASFSSISRMAEFDDPTTPQSDLFISSGSFDVFRFDGVTLSSIAPGGMVGGVVFSLAAFDDGNGEALYAGGAFSSINGVTASRIAKWNGTTWSAVSGGLTSGVQHLVRDLRVWDDGNGAALYVGGMFLNAGGVPARNVAKWDGTAWSALAGGVGSSSGTSQARKLTPFDSGAGEGLLIGGDFLNPAQHMAFWNGLTMTGFGNTNGIGNPFSGGTLLDFAVYDDDEDGMLLIAAGNFLNAGPVAANRIAAWNGQSWRALGPGFNGQVRSVAVFDDGLGGGPQLYASGQFSKLGDQVTTMNALARWDGTQWYNVITSGITVNAADMAVFDDGNGAALYLAGNGSPGFGVIAKLTGSQLTQVGPTLGREVFALHGFDDGTGDALYLGTVSTAVGSAATDALLKWNGSAWIAVGGGVQHASGELAYVRALNTWNVGSSPVLAVGGVFEGAGAVSSTGVIFWNGTVWTGVARRQMTGPVVAIAVHDDGSGESLFAAGGFDIAATAISERIAKLTSSGWEPLSYGLGGGVNCLASYDPDGGSSLFAGGAFTTYFTGGGGEFVRSYGIARWHTCLDGPGFLASPGDQSVPIASDVLMSVQASGGDLTYRWRRNGIALNNNAQQSGVDTPQLTLFSVDESDEGEYDVVVTNAAGTATSKPGTLTVTLPCIGNVAGGDQSVNVTDLLAVISAWGACAAPCPPHCAADTNHDCSVNVTDLLAVIGNWGPCP